MKIFKGMNTSGKCLICKTSEDKPCVLIGIVGTEEDRNMRAEQVHVDCLDFLYYPEQGIIAQKLIEL
jgi:hypothetical protein